MIIEAAEVSAILSLVVQNANRKFFLASRMESNHDWLHASAPSTRMTGNISTVAFTVMEGISPVAVREGEWNTRIVQLICNVHHFNTHRCRPPQPNNVSRSSSEYDDDYGLLSKKTKKTILR